MFYFAIDGDDVGRLFELFMLENDLEAIRGLTRSVKESLAEIALFLVNNRAQIIFCEGDSLFAESEDNIKIPNELYLKEKITFSIGIANSPGDALLALKKAKGLGKKRIIQFR